MRHFRAFLCALAVTFLAHPAVAAQKSRADISAEIATLFAGGSSAAITAAKLRQVSQDIADSFVNSTSDGGIASGFATLDGSGHVPGSQMPAFSGSCTSAAGSTVLSCTGTGTGSLAAGSTPIASCTSGYFLYNNAGTLGCVAASSSIAFPQAASGGVSGGIPYFSTGSQLSASGVLASGQLVVGGGAGTAPSTITTNATVKTALGAVPTGTGGVVLATSPTLVTPVLGVATATRLNNLAITAPAVAATLTPGSGKSFAWSNSLTMAGTDGTTLTFQGTDTYVGRATTDTLTNKTFDTATNTLKVAGAAVSALSGNTAKLATISGTLTSGNCIKSDASGNLVDSTATCGTGGSGGGITGAFDITASAYGSCTTSSTNAATCINAALTACSAAGGGTVWVPGGRWTVTTQITVPSGCSLQGMASPVFNYPSSALNAGGSIIVVGWGAGSNVASNAAIKLSNGAGVRSLGFDYPSATGGAWGSTILAYGTPNVDQFVTDCFFLKAYIAIDFRGSVINSGMAGANILNNRGVAAKYGVALDFYVDFVNVIDNHFNSGWADTTQSPTALTNSVSVAAATSGAAFYLGGGDGVQLINDQAWGYYYGVQIVGGSGYVGKGPYSVVNGAFDRVSVGVQISGLVNTVQVFGNWFVPVNPSSGGAGYAVADAAGTSFDAGVGSLIMNGNFMWGGAGFANITGTSHTLGAVIMTSNSTQGGAGGAGLTVTGGNKTTYIGNVEFNYAAPSVTGGTLDTGGSGGGGADCTTTCTFTGTVTAAALTTSGTLSSATISNSGTATSGNFSTAGQFTSTGGTTPQFSFGSSTGLYGVAGSTVGLEVSGAPLMSVAGFALTLGSGVHGFQDGGGSWIATSDARTKRDVAAYPLGLQELKALRPVSFEYNGAHGSNDTGQRYVGLIAQEVLKTPFKAMVGSHKGPDGEDVLDLNNGELVYALVNAVVSLSAKVDRLEKPRRAAVRRRLH